MKKVRPFFRTHQDYVPTTARAPSWGEQWKFAVGHDSNGGTLMGRPLLVFTLPIANGENGVNVVYQNYIGELMQGDNVVISTAGGRFFQYSQDVVHYFKRIMSNADSQADSLYKKSVGAIQDVAACSVAQLFMVELLAPWATKLYNKLVVAGVSDDVTIVGDFPTFARVVTRASALDVAPTAVLTLPTTPVAITTVQMRVPYEVVEVPEAYAHGERTLGDGGVGWKLYGHEEQTAIDFAFGATGAGNDQTTTRTLLTPCDNLKNAHALIMGICRYAFDLQAAAPADGTAIVPGSKTQNPCPQRFAELPQNTWVLYEGSRRFTEEMSFKYWTERAAFEAGLRCAPNNIAALVFAADPRDEENCSGHITVSSLNRPQISTVVSRRPNGDVTVGGSLGPFAASDRFARAYGNAPGANPVAYVAGETHYDKRYDIIGLFHQIYQHEKAEVIAWFA